MTKILLINQDILFHYRIPVYKYLSDHLKAGQALLMVASGGVQPGNPHQIEFKFSKIDMSFVGLLKLLLKEDPDVVIFWVDYKYLYLFPVLILAKILGMKAIYWGHGIDLTNDTSIFQKTANVLQFWLDDAIILYGSNQIKYVPFRFRNKVFIANNTLSLSEKVFSPSNKDYVLSKYNIHTRRNIIFVGRFDKRKKLEHLLEAHKLMKRSDIGLILVGPDNDGSLQSNKGGNVFLLGPIYGDERFELLSASDVYCLPGWVGLSIVDAFYCGLPLVTEEGVHAPEIMYLKDGVNGFIVPEGDIQQLMFKLLLLCDDDKMREKFSREARAEIMTNGHIETMCKGFNQAIEYVS